MKERKPIGNWRLEIGRLCASLLWDRALQDGTYGAPVNQICTTRDGSAHIGTDRGICRFKKGRWSRVFPARTRKEATGLDRTLQMRANMHGPNTTQLKEVSGCST